MNDATSDFRLFPDRASELASRVDNLFFFSLFIAIFFSILIASLIFYFGIKYRRRSPNEVGQVATKAYTSLEVAWSIIPLGICLLLFYWGAEVYFEQARPPANAAQFYVVGKQWMWKFQHPEGNREINELHIPVGQPIKLLMTSEDVIHSFFTPEFRGKWDVLPGRYTTYWLQGNKVGTFNLFCAEYCGVEHSRMVGRVIVMEPHEYEQWLAGGKPDQPPSATGEAIFNARGCATCHRPDTAARAPVLSGLLGSEIELADGRTVKADETYVRESILLPGAKVVAGYQPVMPTYQGQLSEDDILQLISYIAGLKKTTTSPASVGAPDGGPTPSEPPGGTAQ